MIWGLVYHTKCLSRRLPAPKLEKAAYLLHLPDFDYGNQEGFTNDGVYFWFQNIELEIKCFQNELVKRSKINQNGKS